MIRGLASGPVAQRLVADARSCGGERSRRTSRMPLPPTRLRIPARAVYEKDDVFCLCDTLARAERTLIRAGEAEEAARVAVAFDLLEAGFA